MKYLPIFNELFESDTIIFLILGLVIATIIGIKMNNHKKCIIGAIAMIITYLLCELISNFQINFLITIILLFMGTIAMGGCIGFIISTAIKSFKKEV